MSKNNQKQVIIPVQELGLTLYGKCGAGITATHRQRAADLTRVTAPSCSGCGYASKENISAAKELSSCRRSAA